MVCCKALAQVLVGYASGMIIKENVIFEQTNTIYTNNARWLVDIRS